MKIEIEIEKEKEKICKREIEIERDRDKEEEFLGFKIGLLSRAIIFYCCVFLLFSL